MKITSTNTGITTTKPIIAIIITLAFSILTIILILTSAKEEYLYKQESFKNDSILVCYNTLIVSNENWKLNVDVLTNNNSAGYIKLSNCEVKE